VKVVVNKCYGGFGLSDEAIKLYAAKKGIVLYPEADRYHTICYYTVTEEDRVVPLPEPFMRNSLADRQAYNITYRDQTLMDRDIPRNDIDLVAVVEELGSAASGDYANLQIVIIPDGVDWEIDEYDGMESVVEPRITWG
jgi:hypothetical protein